MTSPKLDTSANAYSLFAFAEGMGVHVGTVHKWIAKGKLRTSKLAGRRYVTVPDAIRFQSAYKAAQADTTLSARAGTDLVRAANRRGMTLTSLAAQVGVSKSALSHATAGGRAIDFRVANAIETLTGYRATAKNWPGGITECRACDGTRTVGGAKCEVCA